LPSIAPAVPQWEQDAPNSFVQVVKQFRAIITNMPATSTVKAFVRYSRHRWEPGAGNALMGEATRTSGPQADEFAFSIANQATFLNTQLVFFQWFVVDQRPDGSEITLAQSPVLSFRIGCPGAKTDDVLKQDQTAVVSRFDNASQFPPDGYVLPHRMLDVRGTGVSAGRVSVIATDHVPTLGQPDIVMFAAGGPPWKLVGWGYTFPFDESKRPTWECMPYEAWFRHPAGWHTSDGNFEIQPNRFAPPTTGGASFPAPPPFWHGPVWDIHLWRRDGAVPLIAIFDDTVSPGGVAFPDGTFAPVAVTPFP
jgi:hypothetical protein